MTELDKVQTRKAYDVVALKSSRNVWKKTSDRYRTELNMLLDKKFNLKCKIIFSTDLIFQV